MPGGVSSCGWLELAIHFIATIPLPAFHTWMEYKNRVFFHSRVMVKAFDEQFKITGLDVLIVFKVVPGHGMMLQFNIYI